MKRAIVIGLALIVLAAFGAWFATRLPSVDRWLYAKMAAHVAGHPPVLLAKPNELAVLLCGTGSPLPDPKRAGACTLVAAGDDLYVVDSGLGSTRNLLQWHVPLDKIKAVLLTHFHSDHIAELGELRLQTWVAGRRQNLKVYGPPGVEDVVQGFNQAYSHDADYRTAHHGEAFLPREDVDMVGVPIAFEGDTAPVLTSHGLTITAIRVDHGPVKPAYGYRFDYRGRSITVSGDTAPYRPLAHAARKSDVLVHEAQSNILVGTLGKVLREAGHPRPAKIMHDIPSYHSTPVEAAQIANDAGAKLLIFTHINPPLPNGIAERAFLDGVSRVRPDGWAMGRDGMLIQLPAHGDAINITAVD